jgi:hypothetical protein
MEGAVARQKKNSDRRRNTRPQDRLRARMCPLGKYPRDNTHVSVPTAVSAEMPLAFSSPTPTSAAGQNQVGTAAFH